MKIDFFASQKLNIYTFGGILRVSKGVQLRFWKIITTTIALAVKFYIGTVFNFCSSLE